MTEEPRMDDYGLSAQDALDRDPSWKEGQPVPPETVDPEHLEFLDVLRESGATNMFGAAPYLTREFGLGKVEAREVLKYWMDSFTYRHPERQRRTVGGG